MASITKQYQRINSSIWIDWIFRLFFTWAFIHTGIVMSEEHYPDMNWLLVLISVWCYFLRWRLIAFVPLLFSEFIHCLHFTA